MSENKSTSAGGGLGLFSVLGVVFIVLKLTGHIAWSWVWVLAPFWGPLVLGLAVLLVIAVIWAVVAIVRWHVRRRRFGF